MSLSRRRFIKSSALAGSTLAYLSSKTVGEESPIIFKSSQAGERVRRVMPAPDWGGAEWIWYPSGRCLPNTFILFRREFEITAPLKSAQGWIMADSRYQLFVGGQRIQWGPAPADPRWQEADPLDLKAVLRPGKNVLGAQVLYYGQGDGTWPAGKAGFLFALEMEYEDGHKEWIVSDEKWQANLCQAWRPGRAKRWYLRALQEEFDARLFPHGWQETGFKPDDSWIAAMKIGGSSAKPSVCTGYSEYQTDIGGDPRHMELRRRRIPMLQEHEVPALRLAESHWLEWLRPPIEYFDVRVPNAFHGINQSCATELTGNEYQVDLPDFKTSHRGAVLTFEFKEQIVGWPHFIIEAAEGTVVEMLVQEAHNPGSTPLMNSHFDAWTRLICKGGECRFESFDFESLRWLQLHIHGPAGKVTVKSVGMRRRVYPWPHKAVVQCDEPALQRLFDATVNTLNNCAQETLVDGMGRERQQYSGDCGHQMHAIYFAFGEYRQSERYLSTFSQGQTLDGFFLDCWPAYDRLARLIQRQLQLTSWGPLLDHGIGFNFDCWHHYLYSGNLDAIREPYPRLLRFAEYLKKIQQPDGLLPVENLGIPSVWLDHVAYQNQRQKQCAFNLYTAAMLEHALAPLARAFEDAEHASAAVRFGREILAAAIKTFWSKNLGVFVNNLPWIDEEKGPRFCDRSLATAVLFDQCPEGQVEPALKLLATCPSNMGFSYPANAGWRLWALARGHREDIILKDMRERWAGMSSVVLNNTLQEDWKALPDSHSQWSHCPVVPLFVLYMNLAGIKPIEPGFGRYEICPRLGDLKQVELNAWTPHGVIHFVAQGSRGDRTLHLELPEEARGELVLPEEEDVSLPLMGAPKPGFKAWKLPEGKSITLHLRSI